MKLLHIYAGPFPTLQGTQFLVGQTCRLLSEAGHEVHLLCYAHAGFRADERFAVHRIPDLPSFRSERSGLSARKLPLDLWMVERVGRLVRELAPDLVHAHHYEALAIARLADPLAKVPLVFHMHSMFGPELSTYLPLSLGGLGRIAGTAIDLLMPRLAHGVVAVSRAAFDQAVASGVSADLVELVRPAAESLPIRKGQARLDGPRITAIYVGNLDRYQGLSELLDGVESLDRRASDRIRIEIATASDPGPLLIELRQRKLERIVEVVPHGSFGDACARLTAAKIALVPRRMKGGAPIKLVNALAAGVPTLVDRSASEQLVHGTEVWAVDMARRDEVAAALEKLAGDERLRLRLADGALSAAARLYDPAKSLAGLERICKRAIDSKSARL